MKTRFIQGMIKLTLVVVLLIMAACGGNTSGTTGGGDAETPGDANAAAVATMPAAQFVAVSDTAKGITETITLSETTTTTTTVADAATLDRGKQIYERRNCASCHGANGEGVEGKGKALVGNVSDKTAFDNFLRTGGTIGNDHLFGANQISPTGMEALYAFVASLK